jgi:hypothetical protein
VATQLIEYKGGSPISFTYVRDGIRGNLDVIARMIELTRSSVVLDKGFEDFVKQLVAEKGYNAHTPTDQLFTFLYDYFHNAVAYIQDVAGRTEQIKDARTTIQDGYGDCDDHAILTATALAMLGYEPLFVAGKYSSDSSQFEHIYTITYVNGERYVFDTTLPDGKLNKEIPAIELREYAIFDYNPELDSIAGLFRGVRNLAKETARNAAQGFGTFAGFLPLGFIPKEAAKLGAAMFAGTKIADHNRISLSALGSRINGELRDLIIKLQNRNISVEVARMHAFKIVSNFNSEAIRYADNVTERDLKTIKKQLLQKLDYIDNFDKNPHTAPYAVHLDIGLMSIAGLALVGFGAYVFLTKRR